jgi:RimJ/RimL family protein N-acetyltransferase
MAIDDRTKMRAYYDDLGEIEWDRRTASRRHDPRNSASAAVLRKSGMKYEGRSRENLKLRDGWRDSDWFCVLEDEWS